MACPLSVAAGPRPAHAPRPAAGAAISLQSSEWRSAACQRGRRHWVRAAAGDRAAAAAAAAPAANPHAASQQEGGPTGGSPVILDVRDLTAAVTPTGRGAAARKAAAAATGRQVLQVGGPLGGCRLHMQQQHRCAAFVPCVT